MLTPRSAGRRSLTYEQRLKKYAMRGFAVLLPADVDMARVSPAIFTAAAIATMGTRYSHSFT
jgi:hypothetical protein